MIMSTAKPLFLFAIRTTTGQELNVAMIVEGRIKAQNIPVKSVLVMEGMKGFIIIEAAGPHIVEQAITGIKHIKGRMHGKIEYNDIEQLIKPKPPASGLNVNDTVEIVGGVLKGMRAKITNIDTVKNEVTLELLEVSYTLPVTVPADHVRLISKAETKQEKAV